MNKRLLLLILLFAVLMSLPWLVPHLGFLALAGFVPLLWAEELARRHAVKRFWLWHYGAFVLWNAATTFWVCNATVGGGIFAVLANALQMSVVFGLFRFSRRHLRGALPYLFLAAMWIAWERAYFDAEISWPWLTLGNAFARSTRLIQWYEWTGSLGGSLWIWAVNLGVFGLLRSLDEGRWPQIRPAGRVAAMGALTLVLAAPVVTSWILYRNCQERSEGQVKVVIAQPNFDPYQKFTSMTQAEQTAVLLDLYRDARLSRDEAVLLMAPETFTSDIVLNHIGSSPTMQSFQAFLQDYPRADLLFGASSFRIFTQRSAPSPLARPYGDGWIENYNSALVTDHSGREEVFHKSKLVVGTEKMPYPRFFGPIDKALGGVMGHCQVQDEVSLLHCAGGIPFGCAICYESVYGEYCTEYVRKGARFMTVITNDAWWGNTPGYRQHLSYSALRAIELRRDIARCANTGISAIINQRGEILQQSDWWEPETMRGEVNLNSEQTFFVRHGDITGRVCTLVFLLLLALLLVRTVSGGFRPKR
ncbi:MAG: apolipoprotein N-acyltransferase [Bacteroidales bacterium]|nr:apolipoprotein N-acyltransferase [Bacteroidales bacterium]